MSLKVAIVLLERVHFASSKSEIIISPSRQVSKALQLLRLNNLLWGPRQKMNALQGCRISQLGKLGTTGSITFYLHGPGKFYTTRKNQG